MKRLSFLLGLAALLCPCDASNGAIVLTTLNSPVSQNFDGLGTGTSTAGLNSGAWVVSAANTVAPTFAAGTTTLQVAQSAALSGSSAGGSYNFRNNSVTSDRAIGFLTSSNVAAQGPRSIMVEITNSTGATLTELSISFDYEKYRSGTRAFNMSFFHGADGSAWTSNALGDQAYGADANNTTAFSPPGSVAKNFSLSGLNIADGANYYLRWQIAGVGGSTNGQAIGIDNFTVSAVPEPTSAVLLGLVGGIAGFAKLRRRRG